MLAAEVAAEVAVRAASLPRALAVAPAQQQQLMAVALAEEVA